MLFGHHLSLNFIIGVFIVLISMHQFFTFGETKQSKNGVASPVSSSGAGTFKVSPSLDHLEPLNEPASVLSGSPTVKQRSILPV